MERRHSHLALFTLSLLLSLSLSSHFEGFEADQDDSVDDVSTHLPPPPPTITQSQPDPISAAVDSSSSPQSQPLDQPIIIWDDDEFEGFPVELELEKESEITQNATAHKNNNPERESVESGTTEVLRRWYAAMEAVSCVFLILFVGNYFLGKKENEGIALAWASRFATKGSVFHKNFSLLGVGGDRDGADEGAPLLLKEGMTGFKFYATGRRYCQGMVATMELKSRHDLISRVVNIVVPRRDEITFEVYMNDESMDHVIFALAKKKKAKAMAKEERDLARFGGSVAAPGGRKWVVEELAVVSESKEVAGDLITEAVLEQVFGDKAYKKYGQSFLSMHFSDQHVGRHRKALVFKFSLPNAKNMADMTRLVALVPYYIDLIGRYKLGSLASAKTEAARQKAAQERYREFQNARQELLHKKKAERRKLVDEAEAKLSAEAIRKKESKEYARQVKKGMLKVKTTRN